MNTSVADLLSKARFILRKFKLEYIIPERHLINSDFLLNEEAKGNFLNEYKTRQNELSWAEQDVSEWNRG